MDLITAMQQRHSVRAYLDKPIEKDKVQALQSVIDACNEEGDLHIQLILDEPKAFDCFMAHYGNFSGVKNYIALIGKRSADLQEKVGYYGEKIALYAQTLGLNTCWVAMSYKKIPSAFVVGKGEKLTVVSALGYGKHQGVSHKSKTVEQVSNVSDETPEWFANGVEAALLAPTALNQQKFRFVYSDGKVTMKTGVGAYVKLDGGIAKYHFELASNQKLR